MSLYDTGLTYI